MNRNNTQRSSLSSNAPHDSHTHSTVAEDDQASRKRKVEFDEGELPSSQRQRLAHNNSTPSLSTKASSDENIRGLRQVTTGPTATSSGYGSRSGLLPNFRGLTAAMLSPNVHSLASSSRASSITQHPHFFSAATNQSWESATLGDGNCLYNAVALAIRANRLEGALTGYLKGLSKKRLAALTRSRIKKKSDIDVLMTRLFSLNHPYDFQRELAPLLRAIAIEVLRASGTGLYPKDVLQNIAALYMADNRYRDDSFLLHHQFIRDKLSELHESAVAEFTQCGLQALDASHAATQDFSNWFHSTGKNTYLMELAKPARSASDLARWGSELELNALALCLNITVHWVRQEQPSSELGVLAGLLNRTSAKHVLGENINRLNVKQLKSLGIVDFIRWPDSNGRPRTFLRFTEESQQKLQAHQGGLFSISAIDAMNEIMEGFSISRQINPHQTARDYIREVYSNELAMKFAERGMFNEHGSFITDEQKSYDTQRLIDLATGIDHEIVDGLLSYIRQPKLAFVCRNDGGHWSFESSAHAASTLHKSR